MNNLEGVDNMQLMSLAKKLEENGFKFFGDLMKRIEEFDELMLEHRIKILMISLKKLGLTENEIGDLVNTYALEQLENNGKLNYKRLEEDCFVDVYCDIMDDFEEEHDTQVYREYDDTKMYSLNDKERYESIFTVAFDMLDYESAGVIIEMTLRPEEENIYSDYVSAVNKLVAIIFEMDEDLASLVEKKLLGNSKTKLK